MIDRSHRLSVSHQAAELGISRSTVSSRSRAVPEADLSLMRRIEEFPLKYPFAGSRMLRDLLRFQGLEVGRRHLRTLMRRMAMTALYRRPNTSQAAPGHRIYPYRLRELASARPDPVWAIDIPYIPMERGFVYLAAVVDWFSRRVRSWRLSITLDTGFCIEALDEAFAHYGRAEIFNTDQGSQFTSEAFTGRIEKEGVRIRMDGRDRWADNVYGERWWRSLKYEEVYLHAYESLGAARAGIRSYLEFYHSGRPPSGLGGQTPDRVSFDSRVEELAA